MSSSINRLLRDVYRLLPATFKRRAHLLVAATALASTLEILGLAALFPLISLIAPEAGKSSTLGAFFNAVIPDQASESRIPFILFFCAAVFVAKNVLLAGHAWVEARFSYAIYEQLYAQLVRKVLTQNYAQIRNIAPSKLLGILTGEIVTVISHSVLPALTLVSETLFLAAIVLFLLAIEPQITAMVLVVLVVLGAALSLASRRLAVTQGRKRQFLEAQRNSELIQALSGMREIVLSNARQKVYRQLAGSAGELANSYRYYQMLATLPRFALELGVVFVLLVIIYVDLRFGVATQAIALQIGVFAASGFRVIIGVNRIVMSTQALRFGQPSLASVVALSQSVSDPEDDTAPIRPVVDQEHVQTVSLEKVSYAYGEKRILDNQTLTFHAGTITCITGSSGEGKSTLLDIVAGLIPCQSGQVMLNGRAILANEQRWRQHVGYVSQSPYMFANTLRRNIALGIDDAKIIDSEVWQALEAAQLGDYVRSLKGGLDAQISENGIELSGGQRQRIGIARALYRRAEVLLLDEPTAALDPENERRFTDTLISLRKNRVILLVSHRISSIASCDRVFRLKNGILSPVQTF